MLHKMKLKSQSFNAIKSGKKIIEARLYDEKRRTLKLGDRIEFTRKPNREEKIEVQVIGLLKYKTFADLAEDYPPEYFGANSKDNLLNSVYNYYTKEKESKYGVLGIRIKRIG